MKCPKCHASIAQPVDPDSIVTCPGCGARLMTKAAALRSHGGKANPAAPAPDPDLTPPVTVPPKPAMEVDLGGEDSAPAAKAAAPGPGSAPAPATLDAVLQELQMLRATQMQILELLSRGGPPPETDPGPNETQVLAPVRSRRRKTVLLIDDDSATREGALVELKQADVPVRAVEDGNAALAAIAEEKPDVIVLELSLAGEMGGKDLINLIKATMEWVDIPIVLWTRQDVSTQKEARQVHGADEVVTKASGAAALVNRVITVFRSS
ncbi:MAG: response regulator [Acidobacteria bacterium]|jgi:CheY-like chemotaxis protein/ribosomal protein S27E|nr:response regulator [Acidobacteriota bacterium]